MELPVTAKNAVIQAQQETEIRAQAAPVGAWSLQRFLPAIILVCAMLVLWILQHPFVGLTHDSQIYLIQGLARLHPDLYSNDVFLRFGSQDQFTIFSPLYASAMRLFGIENAAVILTCLAQASFVLATILLARMLMPARLVWPGIALLCALPAVYGPGQIFRVLEDFATPRLFAETMVILGLVAFLRGRAWLAAALGLAGMLLHPLMAVGGFVVAVLASSMSLRTKLLIFAGGAIAAGATLAWLSLHGHQIVFDPDWELLLRWGLDYLWPSMWKLATWAPLAVTAVTLIAGVLLLAKGSQPRALCIASLVAGASGIAVNYVAGDLMHLVLVVQAQPYRWLWVGTLLSIILLPLIVKTAWSLGFFGRVATLLLAAAWLFMSERYGIAIALLALVAVVAAKQGITSLPERSQKLLFGGAVALLAIAATYHVATMFLIVTAPEFSEGPQFLRNIRAACRSGALPVAGFLLLYFAAIKATTPMLRAGIAVFSLAMLLCLLPFSAREFGTRWYSRDVEAFAAWRALIPPRTEVMWFDGPVSTWLLLQRPSYISNLQETTGLFSRQAAAVMKGRVDRVEAYLSTEPRAAWRDNQLNGKDTEAAVIARSTQPISLRQLCADAPDLRFIVTSKNMLAEPIATAPTGATERYQGYKLYRCEPAHG
jgi:hypothetical protein